MNLACENLLDTLRDVVAPARARRRRAEVPAAADDQVLLERLTRQLGNGPSAALSLVTQTCIELVADLDRGALHRGMLAYRDRGGG